MKGDPTVIEHLNRTLKNELTAINQYFLHSRILKDWGLNTLGDYEFGESVDEMNKFIYDEAALEIFGHADQTDNNLMNKFNMFHMDIKDDEEHEIEIVSREVNKSIPSTLFFLSKLSCRAEKIRFVKNYNEYWDNIDVLITANPIALESKPEGKLSIKINTSYNKDSKSDFELDSIIEFMTDEDLREKILNTKITTYEEIDD